MADAQAHPWPSSPSTLASWVNPPGLVALNIHCRNSLVVQCLRLRAPNAGGLGSILGQGTRSHTLQGRSKILSATTKSTHAASEDPTLQRRSHAAAKIENLAYCSQDLSPASCHDFNCCPTPPQPTPCSCCPLGPERPFSLLCLLSSSVLLDSAPRSPPP